MENYSLFVHVMLESIYICNYRNKHTYVDKFKSEYVLTPTEVAALNESSTCLVTSLLTHTPIFLLFKVDQ